MPSLKSLAGMVVKIPVPRKLPYPKHNSFHQRVKKSSVDRGCYDYVPSMKLWGTESSNHPTLYR